MTPVELLDLFRDEMVDQQAPYLWSDQLIYSYADDAQKMFCRFTDGISDATSPLTQLDVGVGDSYIATSPLILRLRNASRADTGRAVEVVNIEDLPARGWRFDGRVGPVAALVIGEEAGKARTYPLPNEAVTINLSVFRLPLNPVTDDGPPLEIDEQHHRHLLLWMKSLAYGKQDAETSDKTKQRDFDAAFRSYCAGVKAEQQRARFKPRAIAYGGI